MTIVADTANPSFKSGRALAIIIFAGCVVAGMSYGVRISFGVFLQPISADLGWGREVFALSIAIQHLVWGAAQPLAGIIADRYGSGRMLVAGCLMYAAGTAFMAWASSPIMAHITTGMLVGFGTAGCGLWIAFAAVGRVVPPERRTFALGIVSVGASAGQFIMVPIGQAFLDAYGWQTAFLLLALCALAMLPMAWPLRGKPVTADTSQQSFREAMREAARHRGFLLLNAGFFVCGFHVIFMATHLPAYLVDRGLPADIGAWTLGTIGLMNIFGSFMAGVLGDRMSKKGLLCLLYLGRAVAITAFVMLPATPLNAIIFAITMGLVWLSTVPVTSALVAQIFGIQYLGTLFGIVFFSHQVGAFLGAWLGGYLYDLTGSYDTIWWINIALGIFAAIIHYPIDERPIERVAHA
jgi:predicted MFS family arabinose efflux permease